MRWDQNRGATTFSAVERHRIVSSMLFTFGVRRNASSPEEDRISEVETELLVASEEMRELKVEKGRRKRREGFRYCRSLWWL